MGNILGGKKTAKIMKIDGQTMKLKTPISAGEVVKDFPGHVLLESEAVKHFGIRAKPLEPQQHLKAKRLYFLVELPKTENKATRRVRSGIQMSAKDRLESLMLARRATSDLSLMRPAGGSILVDETEEKSSSSELDCGGVRLKLRLPKAEVERLMMASKDDAEAAEKIVQLYMASNNKVHHQDHWVAGHGIMKKGLKSREKRVGFLPVTDGEIQVAMA